MAVFQGKPPGGSAGEMSRRTERLRPAISLRPADVAEARRVRRQAAEPAQIPTALGASREEFEKALVQMRSPRPESTRGTLNVTLAAHKVILAERIGDQPRWKTVDRLMGDLLQLRAERAALASPVGRRGKDTGCPAVPPLMP